jgi:hypothetical protein
MATRMSSAQLVRHSKGFEKDAVSQMLNPSVGKGLQTVGNV